MDQSEFESLLVAAAGGCRASLGRLLQTQRNYLLAVANAELAGEVMPKVGGSDMVQQTFAEAVQSIGQFAGHSAVELGAWLRQILMNNIADLHRAYLGTAARDVRREYAATDSRTIDQFPAAGDTPSSEVASSEEAQRLDAALAQLPEEYREVIELRNRDRLRFGEIGQRMGRTEDAARMLWKRAVERLQAVLHPPPG